MCAPRVRVREPASRAPHQHRRHAVSVLRHLFAASGVKRRCSHHAVPVLRHLFAASGVKRRCSHHAVPVLRHRLPRRRRPARRAPDHALEPQPAYVLDTCTLPPSYRTQCVGSFPWVGGVVATLCGVFRAPREYCEYNASPCLPLHLVLQRAASSFSPRGREPTSPHISPDLPRSPQISPDLPISREGAHRGREAVG